jgi:hypothetical protein
MAFTASLFVGSGLLDKKKVAKQIVAQKINNILN